MHRKRAAWLLLALLAIFLAAPFVHRVEVCADGHHHHDETSCAVCQLALHTPLDLVGPLLVVRPVGHELPAHGRPVAQEALVRIVPRVHAARGPPVG
jgi:hypothetical protein